MNKPATVLVRGAGFENKGAEAMLLTVSEQLRARLPDVVIRAELREESHDEARKHGIVPVDRQWVAAAPVKKALTCLQGIVSKPCLAPWIIQKPGEYLRAERGLSGCSALLDISGFAYSDTFGADSVAETLPFLKYARAHRIPAWFLPQAWGPFSSKPIQRDMQTLVAGATGVYARDAVSEKNIRSVVPAAGSKISICSDIAFLFERADPKKGLSVLQNAGVSGSPLIGVVPNMRIYERTPGLAHANQYVQMLVSSVSLLRRQHDAAVVLMPHEIDAKKPQVRDDRYICNLIKQQFIDDDKVTVIMDAHPSCELKSIIANLDVLMSSRYHSIVAALSSGVPPLVIGWSHKYEALLNDFGISDHLFDTQACTPELNVKKVAQLLVEKDALRARIIAKTGVMKQQSLEMFDHICRKIKRE